jgi:primosomal protein N'
MSNIPYAPSISVGEIVAVQEPTSDTDRVTKYFVRIETENGTSTFISNVVASTFIGGVADGLKIYRRPTTVDDKSYEIDDKTPFGVGERVIVAFINNDIRRGIIIGGYNRIVDLIELPEPEEKKPQMRFQYLGMIFDIDTKGQLTITHTGAPKITDSPEDVPEIDEKKVSVLTLKDDSSFAFVDANKQSIVVDATKKKIEISSDKEKVSIDQKGTIKVESSKEVIVKAPKVALGTSSTELLDLIDKLLEALQKAAPQLVQTAVGPGAMDPNLITAVAEIKTKLSQIKGKVE